MTRSASSASANDPLPRAKPQDVGISSQRLDRVSDFLRAEIARGRMPGAVLAIARNGKLVYLQAFGYRDPNTRAPMRTDSIFSIASMTKPMVAVGALKLLEQGRITIDDPVSKYLPQFASMKVAKLDPTGQQILETVPAARPITLHDLFRHTSGIIYGGRGTTAVHKLYPSGSLDAATTLTSAEFLDKLGSAPLLWQPGTVWDYGFSIDVLGLVIEKITQQPLGAYLRDQLFHPLGMSDSGFTVPAAKVGRFARPFANDPETGKPQPQSDLTMPLKFECGGGCATSTAADYLRFAQMLLDRGTLGDSRILGRKTVEYMLSNQLGPDVKNLIGKADPTRADYGFGLGLAVRTTPGIVPLLGSVGDFSWPGATGTNWWVDPKEKLVVVFMAATPGPLRWYYRESINALVMQALQ
jgi:CubicO group peptidase (beta-lactamase class C family)